MGRVGGEAVTRHLATCTGGLRPSGRALREPMGFNPRYALFFFFARPATKFRVSAGIVKRQDILRGSTVEASGIVFMRRFPFWIEGKVGDEDGLCSLGRYYGDSALN